MADISILLPNGCYLIDLDESSLYQRFGPDGSFVNETSLTAWSAPHAETQSPDGSYFNDVAEAVARQRQMPTGAFVNETVLIPMFRWVP